MAVELKAPVLQIVGFQNSGKTTLLTKIIETVSLDGLKVGTLKHHGHGGSPDVFDEGKDTGKHRQAGAMATGVEGNGLLQLHVLNSNGWSLQEMLSLYDQLPIDLILIEGFKKENFPKIVLLRSEEDELLLKQLDNIKIIIHWHYSLKTTTEIPTFHLRSENDYLLEIRSYLKGKI